MTDERISAIEFANGYNKCVNDGAKNVYLTKLKILKYLDYNSKIALSEKIAKASCINSESGAIELHSALRYVMYVYTVVNRYTNIHMRSENMFEDFDALNRCGLIEKIFEKIPEREIREFETVSKMAVDDLLANEYEPRAYISKQVNRVCKVAEMFLNPFLNLMKEQIETNSVDVNEFKTKISKKVDEFKERLSHN